CIRMTNENIIDLFNRVKVGTIVVVLKPKTDLKSEIAASGPISPLD
ncbi:MAG: L,D-transpeptidase, partial [Xanthobacteraceae bacterium]